MTRIVRLIARLCLVAALLLGVAMSSMAVTAQGDEPPKSDEIGAASLAIPPTVSAAQGETGDTPLPVGQSPVGTLSLPISGDDTHFVVDSGGDLDQYLFRTDRADGRLKFNLQVTRYYFNTADASAHIQFGSNGLLTPASVTHIVSKKILPSTVKLRLRVFDVDEEATWCPELDLIYINGEQLRKSGTAVHLSGANETWSDVTYDVPIAMLRFPMAKGSNAPPAPATNEVAIQVDANLCTSGGVAAWAVLVDYAILEIEGPIRPVIFAHGWTGNTSSFSVIDDRLNSDGIPSAGHADLLEGIYPIADTAEWLSDYIRKATIEFGVNKINLMAHSKGGLVARRALYDDGIARMVERLLTFDSPHHGTDWASLGSAMEAVCHWNKYPNDPAKAALCFEATKEFTPEAVRNTFNYSGCTHSLIFGWSNCRPIYVRQPDVDYRAFAAIVSPVVVPKTTTQYPWNADKAPMPSWSVINVDAQYLTTHGGILERQDAYQCAIHLLDATRFSCPGSSFSTEAEPASLAVASITANQLVLTQAGNVAASGLFTKQIPVDAGTQLVLDVHANMAVTFTLVEPGGRLINPALADADPFIDYATAADLGLIHYRYVISNPVMGPWQVQVQSATATDFVVTGWLDAPISLDVSPDKAAYAPGELITVQAALIQTATALIGGTMVGAFEQPQGGELAVNFYDDGTNGDTAANDGRFTAQFAAPAIQAQLYLKVIADRGATHRESSLLLTISMQTAMITGITGEWPLDDDGDGLIDRLVIQANISVLQGGYFDLQGSLLGLNEAFIQSAQALARSAQTSPLAPGPHSILLEFAGQDLWQAGQDGPYTLTDLILTDSTHQIFRVDSLTTAYMTAAYAHSQFEHAPLYFLGGSDTALDTNGNNRYDTLTVHLQFGIEAPGSYVLNGRLVDVHGGEIAWSASSFSASTAGGYAVDLIFNGADIGSHRVNGPFVLQDVSLYNTAGAPTAYFSSPFTTGLYEFTHFEAGYYQVALPLIMVGSNASNYAWLDATVGGTIVAQLDDTYQFVSLPFAFSHYGNLYTGVYVSSNGFVSFGAGYSSLSNHCLPNGSTPNNAIYAFWDDLVPNGGGNGNVYVKQIDPGTFVVEWYRVRQYGTSIYQTFEIVLRSDHSATLQYQAISNASSVTVGVENLTGQLGLQRFCNGVGMPLANQTAIRYTMP
jgi:pimeloyl-ACP methyl ester carboxylesterase